MMIVDYVLGNLHGGVFIGDYTFRRALLFPLVIDKKSVIFRFLYSNLIFFNLKNHCFFRFLLLWFLAGNYYL